MRSFCWRLSPFQHARQCRQRSAAILVVLGLREQMCLTGVSRWEAGSCQAAWASSGKADSGLVPAMPTMMFSFLGLPQDVLQKNTFLNGEFSRFEGFVCFKIAAYAHYMSQNPHLYDSQEEIFWNVNVSKFYETQMFVLLSWFQKENTVLWELSLPCFSLIFKNTDLWTMKTLHKSVFVIQM